MDEFIKLMDNFWIIREDEREDYYKIKRILDKEMKDFFHKCPDWRVVINNKLIKLEKIPVDAMPSMGISEFESITDYCLFCAVLIYLDDKSEGDQFLLTELTESVERIAGESIKIDFTSYSDRKSLVRVLKFSQSKNLIKISEGSIDNAASDKNAEILYENTGYSVYFSIHHDEDISGYTSYRDFENYDKNDNHKSNRVYRRLLLTPAVYWSDTNDADSIYLKNFRSSLSKHLDEYLEGRLDIYNGSAFYLLSNTKKYGEIFPSDKMISGIAAFICGELIDKKIRYFSTREDFNKFIITCRKEFNSGLSKEYREMSDEKFQQQVYDYMKSWMFIDEKDEQIIISDGAFLSYGKYPSDFKIVKEDK